MVLMCRHTRHPRDPVTRKKHCIQPGSNPGRTCTCTCASTGRMRRGGRRLTALRFRGIDPLPSNTAYFTQSQLVLSTDPQIHKHSYLRSGGPARKNMNKTIAK